MLSTFKTIKGADLMVKEFSEGIFHGLLKSKVAGVKGDFRSVDGYVGDFYSLFLGENKVGSFLILRKDRKVYNLLLIGVYFKDFEGFWELAGEKIKYAYDHKPKYDTSP